RWRAGGCLYDDDAVHANATGSAMNPAVVGVRAGRAERHVEGSAGLKAAGRMVEGSVIGSHGVGVAAGPGPVHSIACRDRRSDPAGGGVDERIIGDADVLGGGARIMMPKRQDGE